MKSQNRHQRGMTIDELRMQRAVTTFRIALEKHKLSSLFPGMFGKDEKAENEAASKADYIRTALTYADFAVNLITIFKKISQIYSRLKK